MKITSPDKMRYGVTKQEIADYYQRAAARMLPFIKGRVLTLIKCPVAENCFYHRNPDIYIDNLAELIEQIQMNTMEIHIPGNIANSNPDIMIFDLDPDEGMELKKVLQGVKDLKSILDELSLVSYLKTSGGKGYHIVVPFTPSANWETFRAFAKSIADIMEQKWPDRYTANVRKVNRKGKIFIDWIRNTKKATSVAPYSIRARNGAPVSVPIEWSELEKIAPADIKMHSSIERLSQKDPWESFFKIQSKQRLI